MIIRVISMCMLVPLLTRVNVLQDIALETAIPRSAICQMEDARRKHEEDRIPALEDGWMYHNSIGCPLISGSRAEGLALENAWGHEDADEDLMILYGRSLGVHVSGGQQSRGESGLNFRPEGCPPAYCKLEISDLRGFKECLLGNKDSWFDESCVEESGRRKWLNIYNSLRCMRDALSTTRTDTVSGPATQSEKYNMDTVHTLVCSGPHHEFHLEFLNRTRGPWPSVSTIKYLLKLPMLLVLVGHKLSSEFKLQARVSWSLLEYILMKELSENVRQGYIACKYVAKRFLKVRRGQNAAGDGRSHVGSYHIKTVFLRFLEKKIPIVDHVLIWTVFRPFSWVGQIP